MKPRRVERRIGARTFHPYLELTWTTAAGKWPRRTTRHHRARVINLSPSGLLFETGPDIGLHPHEQFSGYVGQLPAFVEVVRFEPSPDGHHFHYGAVFHSLSDELAEFIRGFDPRGEQVELIDAWLYGR